MSKIEEIRKLPKKTIFIISIIIIVSFSLMYGVSITKKLKVEDHLHTLSYSNVANITVYNKSEVQDAKTKQKGYLFKVKFDNLNTNQVCKGLIFTYFRTKNIKQDIDCK